MALLSLLKSKLLVIGAGLIAFLLVALKFMTASRARAVKRADRAEAQVEFKKRVEESDTELSKDLSSRKAKISKEIKSGEEITSLSDPNNWD